MTSKAGHTFTAGPWEVVPLSGCGGPYAIRMAYMSDNPRASKTYYGVQGVGTEANARLIAEAGTILHETGLTPRQLAERCEKLEEAAKELLSYATLDSLLDKVESGAEHPNDVFCISLGDLLKLRAAFDWAQVSKLTDDEIVELASREAALGPDKAGGA